MRYSNQIRNWITIAISFPVGKICEDFYYDIRANEFFSIVLTDRLMVDNDLNKANDVTTSYTEAQESSLIDRIKRIELNDPDIISIERISLAERKAFMQQFVDNLTNDDLVKILQQRIYNQDYNTKFDFYFGKEADEATIEKWEQIKERFLNQRVDEFLNLNNINIDTATLWDVEANASITLHLSKNNEVEIDKVTSIVENKKPWWRFW